MPQLCAWKLGFSPLTTGTTSAGKAIAAASAPLHYAPPAGGRGGPPAPALGRCAGAPRAAGAGHEDSLPAVGSALLSSRQALRGLDADNPGKEPPNNLCFGDRGK